MLSESQIRKENSIKLLKKYNVPYIDHLPVIEDSRQAKIKTIDQIAKRAICTLITIQYACDILHEEATEDNKEFWLGLLENYKVKKELTKKEKFIFSGKCTAKDATAMTWKYEAYWVLVWAMGFVDELEYPDGICDCDEAIQIIQSRKTYKEFLDDAKMRSEMEILDQADLIYRLDWACVDARINQQQVPANLNDDVVVERHMALNWLIGYDDDWDNVSIDT
jgi:hypothetical protein